MLRAHRNFLAVLAFLFVSFACTFMPELSTPDIKLASTFAAQTVYADLTKDALTSVTSTISGQPMFTSTETPTGTITPTETLTVTPLFTPTPFRTIISVSTPTNCRNGPGKVYEMKGSLLVGAVAEVVGRDPTGEYWYIRNPDSDPEFCWVWGKYATLTGPSMTLPILTPPPTPTPTNTPLPTSTPTPSPVFKVAYSGLDSCNGSWWVEVKLKNKGTVPFKSVNISVKDKVTNVTVVNLSDGFTNLDGCLTKTTQDKLGVGDTYLLSAPAFTYDPTGHEILSIITLCSGTGQKGTCVTDKITFTP
jgi:hypothetical protein